MAKIISVRDAILGVRYPGCIIPSKRENAEAIMDLEPSKKLRINPIICIGTTNGIEVNAFTSSYKSDGVWHHRPCVEIARMNSVQMRLPEVEAVIDLLQEALAFWQEEGNGIIGQ